MTWTEGIVTALIAATAGLAGSFLNPWASWLFEKKKLERSDRKEKIAGLRRSIEGMWTLRLAEDLKKHPAYHILEPHLSSETVAAIESWQDDSFSTAKHDAVIRLLQKDVTCLERKWGLV